MRHADIVTAQDRDLVFIDVNAVCGHDLDVKHAVLFNVGDHRRVIFVAAIADLQGGLGQVDLQGHVELGGQIRASA